MRVAMLKEGGLYRYKTKHSDLMLTFIMRTPHNGQTKSESFFKPHDKALGDWVSFSDHQINASMSPVA